MASPAASVSRKRGREKHPSRGPGRTSKKLCFRRTLKVEMGGFYFPMGGREPGVDAHFFKESLKAFGIADGVEAGEFAEQLMRVCEAVLQAAMRGSPPGEGGKEISLERVLAEALAMTTAEGTSTACVGMVDGRTLLAVNIGDTGFLVVRRGMVAYRSPVQERGFNQPFQVGREVDRAYPLECAKNISVELQPGDIIVAGTDGLFDNMFSMDILAVIVMNAHRTPQQIAHALASETLKNQYSRRETPFSLAARKAKCLRTGGGKPDDITIVVAIVR